jgi:hypothetical protein
VTRPLSLLDAIDLFILDFLELPGGFPSSYSSVKADHGSSGNVSMFRLAYYALKHLLEDGGLALASMFTFKT